MSGTSYTEEHLIDSDDNKDDPYDLGLTLEETEDDFNIEDITEDQVKEILADEENRFLLEDDDPIETSSSQINIIDRRVNDKPSSAKGKSTDSKSYRNTGNLITIDCDDEEDEDESELDDRRHSKFKSERVIRTNDKKNDDKDIPETLEAVVLDTDESSKGNRAQPSRGNYNHHHYNNNQRGGRHSLKGRNFVPSSRPFIGNNSLSSMGLLPTPLQSFNRIHVNPNFKPVTNQGPRLSSPMNNFRQRGFPGGMNGRMSTPNRLGMPRNIWSQEGPPGPYVEGPMIPPNDPLEHLIASQMLPEHELGDPNSSHHHYSPNNNTRPPLFNEPFSGNWSNQVSMSNQPWMKHNNRPPMDNFQRLPGQFNLDPTPRSLLLGSRVPVHNSLFGSPQRHLMQSRFSGLPLFNQPNFPLMSRMEFPGNPSTRIDITPHPVPVLQRHQIPLHLVHTFKPNTPSSKTQNRPSGLNNTRPSSQQDVKPVFRSPAASTSGSSNHEQISRENHQFKSPQNDHKSNFASMEVQDPSSSHHSIHKVTTSPSQRTPRPSTSNVNLKNIRQIKTIGPSPSTTSADARKAALLKTKAACRFLQKENMNRGVTSSVKQIEVVDLDSAPVKKEEDAEQDKPQPMVVDLEIDEDYRKKLEEQKRLREEIIKKKEERRKQMVAEKMKQGSTPGASTSNSIPSTSTAIPNSSGPLSSQLQRRVNPLSSTLIERVSPPNDIQIISEKNVGRASPLKRKASLSSTESIVEISDKDARKVEIKGLAITTTNSTITKLCNSVGQIEGSVIEVIGSEKKATITFKTSQDARSFQTRYQRHLVDLCVIQVSLLW